MTTMAKKHFRIKINLSILLVLTGILLYGYSSFGYVMPAEQILDFMTSNFKGVRTVTLIQSTLQTFKGNEKVFTEQVWLESPDKYFTKPLDRLGERDAIVPDLLYRQLLIANSREKIERILLSLGIDLTKTSFTRLDGVIAYRIGSKDPGSPKLLVEKKRFLPLLLVYKVPGEAGNELKTVRFEDYQKKDKGWYPFEITYKSGDSLVEKYTVQTFQENMPIDASILKTFPEYALPETPEPTGEPGTNNPGTTDVQKEQLKDVIKAFEEQYQ